MRTLFLILTVTFSLNSCAMGGRPAKFRERKDQDKLWRPCQSFETSNPVGKFCNRVCVKRKKLGKGKIKKCKKWKTNVKDFNNEKDFLFFRNNAMILIDEDLFL